MFIKITESVLSYLRTKEMEVALADLSDAALDDIGLTRVDLGRLTVTEEIVLPEIARSSAPLFEMPFRPLLQAA
ncbi:DUF1127 domain-containing protein [Methylorubrum suomiense]|uniref:DUF1127 domain-containing protein n=1 Tax=Methylorubrum suomiense TaxID=144191 RepID=A0ABQ4V0Q5_9HYPH|nr:MULTISPECIES: DUF1127 domain-containing protein [Methylobacteriaceae]GJE76922.1 hypothetical protein BGCPKDLD_3522 [Methylorubrum suomiense]